MKLIVERVDNATPDIRVFRLVRADGSPLPPYEPGAHIDVTGPTGVTRQYSLCGAPDDASGYTIAVKRESASRGGSAALHDHVGPGAELEIGEPRNLFRLVDVASEHLLVGAGIGITPLMSFAYRLAARQAPFTLHYFARSREAAAFVPVLESSEFAANVRFHYGVARERMADALSGCIAHARQAAQIYTCGPAPFMQAVVDRVEATRADCAVHLEHFGAPPAAALDAGDRPFTVEIASSGDVLCVPANERLVDVLLRAGIAVDTSCREGICGTCVVPVLDGVPDHRDHCLSKKEKAANDQICACVSRARTEKLLLDL
jgi:ferredoxin-NADP reductase